MRFEDHVERALGSLPPELRRAVRNLEIAVEEEHPEDPDLFDYVLHLYDGDGWRTIRFSADDRQAAGYLFVVAVSQRPGRAER